MISTRQGARFAKPPNIVVFFTDQQRWDTTGAHGNPLELTPHFDAMAANGTHAEFAFTPQPLCVPARACIQTGLHASATGIYRPGIGLSPGQRTVAHYLNEAGYDTALIGKWHLGGAKGSAVPEPSRGGYRYWLGSESLISGCDGYRTILYDNDNAAHELPGFRSDAVADAAIRYLSGRQGQARPFYLFLSLIEPHQQNERDEYAAPAVFRDRYHGRWTPPDLAALPGTAHMQLSAYYALVRKADEALGRVHDALISLGLADDTVVFFTSDHGNHFNTRNPGCKRSCHESSIRVPLAVTGREFNSGGRLKELVSLLDIPATILDLAGVPVPSHWHGRSLLPLVNRTAADWPQERLIQTSVAEVGRAIRTKRWKYGVTAEGLNPKEHNGSPSYVETSLYDLRQDPYELRNLAGVPGLRGMADQLKRLLIRRMAEAGEETPEIRPAPVQMTYAGFNYPAEELSP